MDAQQVQLVAAQLQEENYEPGAAIMQQVITEHGPGEYVGEIDLLLKMPRPATVRAVTPARLLSLQKDDFDRLVADHLCVSRGLERDTSRRMIDLRRAV